jgi:hypothetical protein
MNSEQQSQKNGKINNNLSCVKIKVAHPSSHCGVDAMTSNHCIKLDFLFVYRIELSIKCGIFKLCFRTVEVRRFKPGDYRTWGGHGSHAT